MFSCLRIGQFCLWWTHFFPYGNRFSHQTIHRFRERSTCLVNGYFEKADSVTMRRLLCFASCDIDVLPTYASKAQSGDFVDAKSREEPRYDKGSGPIWATIVLGVANVCRG